MVDQKPGAVEDRDGALALDQAVEHLPVVTMPIRLLLSPDSPRLEGENDAHVRALAESDIDLPPILVHRNTMRVIDGAHRLRAASKRGQREIQVRLFSGGEADAFVLAVQANVAHGLPLSRADRAAAAERIISSHPRWSDRAVAVTTGLAAKTIAVIRHRVTEAGDLPQVTSRVGSDGRTRPIDASHGRRTAGTLIQEHPDWSLRQIAARAGISQATARDVRDRLSRREDPVLPKRRNTTQIDDVARKADVVARRRIPEIRASVEDRNSLLEQLKRDPSLRFSEAGRRLIRMLDMHCRCEREWDRIADAVPAHCRLTVVELVKDCADMWQELASRVDQNARSRAR